VKDQLNDLGHYVPDQCTITYQCEGRLFPIDYVSNGSPILDVPPVGVSNWYPRGSTFSTTTAAPAPTLVDTSTGSTQQVIVALPFTGTASPYPDDAILRVTLGYQSQSSQAFLQYTYKRSSPFTIINGVEDGTGKKVLRYNVTGGAPDSVVVYINGVKRNQGTASDQYQLYDGTVGSPCPPNSVYFNSTVTGTSTQVDVVVTKAPEASEVVFNFTKMIDDESRAGTGAWEGVEHVRTFNGNWILSDLFYLDFSEFVPPTDQPLPRDTPLNVAKVELITNVTTPISSSTVSMLLSREKLHLTLDRIKSSNVALSVFDGLSNWLVCKFIDDVRVLLFTEAAATSVFPPMEVLRFSPEALATTGLGGDTDATQLDSDLIVGPDS
jgi:hypothetical protein